MAKKDEDPALDDLLANLADSPDMAPLGPREQGILEAALKVFHRKGYGSSRTREIAQEAGVSEATIFKYFPSKESLMAALMARFAHSFVKPLLMKSVQTLISKQIALPGQDAEDLIALIILDRLVLFRQNSSLLVTVIMEAIRHPEYLAFVRTSVLPEIVRLLVPVLELAQAQGKIGAVDPGRFVRTFISLVLGHLVFSDLAPELFHPGSDGDEARFLAGVICRAWKDSA